MKRLSTKRKNICLSITLSAVALLFGCSPDLRPDAEAAVERWVDKLDQMTDDSGVYIKWEGDTLPEDDPWGNPLLVAYSQGGFAQDVTVRSLGPDGKSQTADDVVAVRASANLKGVGAGLKKNVEEFSEKGAKGAAKGFISGIKEGLKKDDSPETPPEENN